MTDQNSGGGDQSKQNLTMEQVKIFLSELIPNEEMNTIVTYTSSDFDIFLDVEFKSWWNSNNDEDTVVQLFENRLWNRTDGILLINNCVSRCKNQISLLLQNSESDAQTTHVDKEMNLSSIFSSGADAKFLVITIFRLVRLLASTRAVQKFNTAKSHDHDGLENKVNPQFAITVSIDLIIHLSNMLVSLVPDKTPVIYTTNSNHDAKLLFVMLLLKIIQPLSQQFPPLLAPTWKSLCDVLSSLNINSNNQHCVSCYIQSITLLSSYIRDGADQMQNLILTYCSMITSSDPTNYDSTSNPTKFTPLLQHQIKLIQFFLLRLGSLLPTILSFTSLPDSCLDTVVSSIYKLNGLFPSFLLLSDTQSVQLESRKKVHECLKTISQKVDNFVIKITIKSQGQSVKHAVYPNVFRKFVSHPTKEDTSSLPEMKESHLRMIWDLGKLRVLTLILEHLTPKLNVIPNDDDMDMNSMLTLCDVLIFQTLPSCQSYFSLQSLPTNNKNDTEALDSQKLLSKIIDVIVSCTLACESYNPKLKYDTSPSKQIHRLLVRWLFTVTSCSDVATPSLFTTSTHPFSSEIVLTVVQIHIVRSFILSKHHFKSFITFLTRIMLDCRTTPDHRMNISTIFYRLLCTTNFQQDLILISSAIESILCHEVNLFLKADINHPSLKEDTIIKKRKRSLDLKFDTNAWFFSDLHGLIPILEVLSFRQTFWNHVDDDVKKEMIQTFSQFRILSQNATKMQQKPKFSTVYDRQYTPSMMKLVCLTCGFFSSFIQVPGATKDTFDEMFSNLLLSVEDDIGTFHPTLLRLCHLSMGLSKTPLSPRNLHRLNNALVTFSSNKLHAYAIVGLLSVLGPRMGSDVPTPFLQTISSIFSELLSSKNLGIVCIAMSAMEKFASSLLVKHRNILPKSIPVSSQPLFQSRLKGETFSFSSQKMNPNIRKICRQDENSKLIDYLQIMIKDTKIRKIYSTHTDITILSGSRICTIRSKEDHSLKAIIIVPSGQNDDRGEGSEQYLNQILENKELLRDGTLTQMEVSSHGLEGHFTIEEGRGKY